MPRVAVLLSGNRVAARAERCERVLIAEVDEGGPRGVATVSLLDALLTGRPAVLSELGVETLVCGTIGEALAARIRGAGIRLVASCWGDPEQVLLAVGASDLDARASFPLGAA